jgi:hypothetical protein
MAYHLATGNMPCSNGALAISILAKGNMPSSNGSLAISINMKSKYRFRSAMILFFYALKNSKKTLHIYFETYHHAKLRHLISAVHSVSAMLSLPLAGNKYVRLWVPLMA